jgi:hypothetical protein
LLTIEAYNKLMRKSISMVDLLTMPAAVDVFFGAPRLELPARPADLR